MSRRPSARGEAGSRLRLQRLFWLILFLALAVTFPRGWGRYLAQKTLKALPLPSGVEIGIDYLSPCRVVLSLTAGASDSNEATAEEALRLKRCEVNYSPWGMMQRRIDGVRLSGVAATVALVSNQLSVVGLPKIEMAATNADKSGKVWQVTRFEAYGTDIKLVTSAGKSDLLNGSFRYEGGIAGEGILRWQGHLLGAAGELTGRVATEPLEGGVTITIPKLMLYHLQPLLREFLPALNLPLVDGGISLKIEALLNEEGALALALLGAAEEPLTIMHEGYGAVCDALELSAGIALEEYATELAGWLHRLNLEATLARTVGLPPPLATHFTNVNLQLVLPSALPLASVASEGVPLAGKIVLPTLQQWQREEGAGVECALTLAPERGGINITLPALQQLEPDEKLAASWRCGGAELLLNYDFSQEMSGAEMRLDGSLSLSDFSLQHAMASLSGAAFSLPLQALFSATNQLPAVAVLRPELKYESARIKGCEVILQSLIPAQPDTGFSSYHPPGVVMAEGGWAVAAEGLLGGELLFDALLDLRNTTLPAWHMLATLRQGRVQLDEPVAFMIEGLESRFDIDSDELRLVPTETTFTNMVIAGLQLDGGKVRWRLDRNELLIERGEFDWCGGKLRLYAVRVNLHEPDVDLILYAEQLDAGKLLALVKPLSGEATGRLYGRIPLQIRGDRVVLSEGFFYALPGESGSLKLHDTSFLRNYIARTGLPQEMQQNIIATLADMNYSVLRFDLDSPASREARLAVKIAGEAANNKRLPPVDLDIRINGPLEALLNLGIHLNRGGR